MLQHDDSKQTLILASASPRRLELLSQIHIKQDEISAADIDESAEKNEAPSLYVRRISFEKASKVAKAHPDAFILAADTAVARGKKILPKAQTNEEVMACLRELSGKRHTVYTGVCILAPNGAKSCRHVATRVSFKRLTQDEMLHYVETGDGIGKAGGYAIQGVAGKFVQWINGSYSAVVGLPLCETATMLEGLGYRSNKRD